MLVEVELIQFGRRSGSCGWFQNLTAWPTAQGVLVRSSSAAFYASAPCVFSGPPEFVTEGSDKGPKAGLVRTLHGNDCDKEHVPLCASQWGPPWSRIRS